MKIHINLQKFYHWFRVELLHIGGGNSEELEFEYTKDFENNNYDQLYYLKFDKQVVCLTRFEWIRIFEQYLQSNNLFCVIEGFDKFAGKQNSNKIKKDITLYVKFYGESYFDSLEIE